LKALLYSSKFSLQEELSVGSVSNSDEGGISHCQSIVSRLRKHALDLNNLLKHRVGTHCGRVVVCQGNQVFQNIFEFSSDYRVSQYLLYSWALVLIYCEQIVDKVSEFLGVLLG
jgi:hypothetical protein